ncbi:hypothetical protein ACEWY4_010109 [Coilia grayii]|uniref:Claudin n=1 Tax=Coilia grayii TaxID=363190 RepID=A0ABD1K8E0_9TELE
MSMGLEIGGISLGLIGWIIAIVTCALPMWKVTAFVGANIITAQTIWEGLWMNCVVQSTGQMQCKVYDSMLALSSDMQAARAMTIIAIILGVLGVLIAIMGAKCTNCIEDEASKAKTMIFAGVMFIIAGILVLIPVSWTADQTIKDFYNPLVPATTRRELGASLYIGWASAALLIFGGIMLCSTCPPREKRYKPPKMAYTNPNSASAAGSDMQAARAMTVIAIILGVLGVLIAIMGAKCTNCIEDEASKAKTMIFAGVMFIIAGILVLIPVSWTADQTIKDFYNPLVPATTRRELGASLYIGWASAALLIFGGIMLCCTCPPREERYKPRKMAYTNPNSASAAGYDRKDYV